MGDLLQRGPITTLHLLRDREPELIEAELEDAAVWRPVTLVLPALISELDGSALAGIVQVLESVNYLHEIVITLGPATEEEFQTACKGFLPLKTEKRRVRLIWNSGPRISALLQDIRAAGLDGGPDSKARSCWMAYGYIVSRRESYVIALHDCNIVSYGRNLLSRLIYPTLIPDLDYHFAKGYYNRIADRMQARTVRLLITPLLQALIKRVGNLPLLHYFSSFRDPTAGEYSMLADLARVNRIPADGGLEIGVLTEIYRNCPLSRICRVELGESCEKEGRDFSPGHWEQDLHKIATHTCRVILGALCSSGVVFGDGFFRTLRAAFLKEAHDLIAMYHDDARINGVHYDHQAETAAVEMLAEVIGIAGEAILKDPTGPRLIPNWNRVFKTIPGFAKRLLEAVELDNRPSFD